MSNNTNETFQTIDRRGFIKRMRDISLIFFTATDVSPFLNYPDLKNFIKSISK